MVLNACQAKVVYKFKNVKLKLLKTNENIKYNKACLNLNIVPNYISVKVNSNSNAAIQTKKMAEKIWIKKEIEFLYSKKTSLNKLLLQTHLEVLHIIHPVHYDDVMYQIDSQINKIMKSKRTSQDKKIKKLLVKKQSNNVIKCHHQFFPRVVNSTDIKFETDEINLLNKGLNYNFPPKNHQPTVNEVLQIESAIRTIKGEEIRNSTRVKIVDKINSCLKQTPIQQTSRGIITERQVATRVKNKLADHDALLLKADKGNSIVVMSKRDYIDKVNTFISDNNIVQIDNDPTSTFAKQINKVINNSTTLLSPNVIKYVKVTCPSAPTLRGLPKIHKDGVPIRPLVNYTSSPAYKLSKKIDRIIRNEIGLINSSSLKNSLDLIRKTATTQIKGSYILASLDIVNLYTSVPVEETIRILHKNLKNNSKLQPKAIDELITIVDTILSQNYFQFDNKFYTQGNGLAMGSPLSSILSEVFLNNLENNYLWSDKNKQKDKIVFYHRYVDDTIILFNGNARQLNILNNFLNSIHRNIKFTLEVEDNNSINFLDLNIMKKDNRLKFNIYRKPTMTDQTIHASSHHPQSQKYAAYNSYVHRLLTIPMDQVDYNNEVTTIKHIAVANGYDSSIVDGLIHKHKLRNTNDVGPRQTYVVTNYGTKLSYTLRNELKKHNINVAFKTSDKLDRLVRNDKMINVKNVADKSGVYKITCDDCPKYYIGQTRRSFRQRFKEHLPLTPSAINKSAYAAHIVDSNHSYTSVDRNLEVISTCKESKLLDCLEEFNIYESIKNESHYVLNEQTSFKSNIMYEAAIKISKRRAGGRDKD